MWHDSSQARTERVSLIPDEDDSAAVRRRDALTAFMDAHGLKPAAWAALAGLTNANSLYNFLGGRSASLSQATYERLAASVPGATVAQLTGERAAAQPLLAAPIWIRAEAAAGRLRATPELSVQEQTTVAFPASPLAMANAFGVRVRTRDMERVFPPGSLVACVPAGPAESRPTDGRYVLVHARRGQLWEVTLRQYRVIDGQAWTWPRSDDPEHQAPHKLGLPGEQGREERYVAAVVIGAYVPLGSS